MDEQTNTDAVIARLAGRQHGVVGRAQLLAAGIGRGAIDLRIARGSLVPVHRGVYAVGHTALSQEGRWMAAVLACGAGAVLSHHSAAVCWKLAERDDRVHVTSAALRRVDGVATHRARLVAADVAVHQGVPVTSPARTLADLAQCLDDRALERVVREAQFRRLFDPAALRDALTRRPSRQLRELLDDLNPSQSVLEDAFLRLCRRHRIPAPEAQPGGRDGRPDFVWRDRRLIVEVDSWSGHGTPRAFQADRTRSNAAQLAGWTILRFTWADVTRRPDLVAAQLRAALGLPAV